MPYNFNEHARAIGERIIEEWHSHLIGVQIAYITKDAPASDKPMRGGKALKLGKAGTLAEKYQLLAKQDYEFVIELNGAYWNRLTLEQQEALIDHELCHCRQDADGFYVADHDVEEFRQILRRHGFWKPDIQKFCEEAQPLFAQPGIQMRFTESANNGDVVVCGGQVLRVEETGELWTYSPKESAFIRVEPAPESQAKPLEATA